MKRTTSGFWLPDRDTFFTTRPGYELRDYNQAMLCVDQFRTAVDIGAHCGFWTCRLMDKFEYVIAFEPMVEHYECLIENTANRQNVSAFNYALGDANSTLFMTQHFENSGMSKVSDTVTDILVEQYTLDSVYNYQFGPIDFIKIDAEGHEPRILLGAERTIISHKPVICIEILPNAGPEVYSILLGLGYRVVAQVECNYIFKHSQECQ